MLAAILTISGTTTVLTSCSSDNNDELNNEQTSVVNNETRALENVLQQVNNLLTACDFKDLNDLKEAINQHPLDLSLLNPSVYEPLNTEQKEKLSALEKKLVESLKKLLNLLTPEITTENNLTIHKDWAFSNLSETMTLGMEVLAQISLLKNEEDKLIRGQFDHQFTKDLLVKVNDTLTYRLSTIENDQNLAKRGLLLNSNSQIFFIYKNEELLLTLYGDNLGSLTNEDGQELDIEHHGGLIYKDYLLSYSKERNTMQHFVSKVNILKGEDIIVSVNKESDNTLSLKNLLDHDAAFQSKYEVNLLNGRCIAKGSVSNVNKMCKALASLLLISTAGTSKEKCEALVNEFNGLVTTELAKVDTDMGSIYLGTKLSDSDKNLYKPTVIADLRMFEEPMGLNEAIVRIIKMITES